MLHSYVALVSTRSDPTAFTHIKERLALRLRGWVHPLDGALACAWVHSAKPSQLGWRSLGRGGCLIGRDFSPTASPSALLEQSWGAYVALEVDEAARQVTVLRDPTGRVEAWRLSLDGADVIFSHYEHVYWLQDAPSDIDWDYVGHHLNQDYMHGEATGLAGVLELLPGQALLYRQGPPQSQMRWWPHKIAKAAHTSVEDALQALRTTASRSVETWADAYGQVGLYLSGGLDSAIVLGLLRQRRDRRVVAINHSFPGREGDERQFARAAATLHGVRLIEEAPQAVNMGLSAPFSRRVMRPRARILTTGNDLADARLATNLGLEALFTGTGGDHLFYEGLPISAAGDYLHHRGSMSGFIGAALDLARLSRETVWSVFVEALRYGLGRGVGVSAVPRVRNSFLSDAGRAAADFERFTHPWVTAAAADATPPAKFRQICYLTELQRHYSRYGFADTVEEIHPLFSQPLVEASLATPAYWFALDGLQRGLARRAFQDVLPPDIRDRRSKGASTTFVLDFLGHSLPRIRELLLEGQLAGRGLLDRAAVERALTPLNLAAAKDFPAIFTCLPTELWLQQAAADRENARQERARRARQTPVSAGTR